MHPLCKLRGFFINLLIIPNLFYIFKKNNTIFVNMLLIKEKTGLQEQTCEKQFYQKPKLM